jgi:hypothetical protein
MPQGTPSREEHKHLAAVVLFDAIPTGWVSNISQRPNIFVDFLLQQNKMKKIRQTNFYTIIASEYRRCNDLYQIRRPLGLAFVIYFWWLGELLPLYI